MIFRPELAALVLCGEKTVTRRPTSRNQRSTWYEFGPRIYVGQTYAVQAGRGKRSLGRIRVLSLVCERLGYLDPSEARREGFPSPLAFWRTWSEINGDYETTLAVWRIEFEYVGPFYGTALARPLRSVAWELRTSWARGLRVSLSIDADVERVEGHVQTVSATDAFVVVAGLHVPLDRILAVHRPSRLGDSTFDDSGSERFRGYVPRALRRDPRQTALGEGGVK